MLWFPLGGRVEVSFRKQAENDANGRKKTTEKQKNGADLGDCSLSLEGSVLLTKHAVWVQMQRELTSLRLFFLKAHLALH